MNWLVCRRLGLNHDADQKQFVQLADIISVTTRIRVGVDLPRGIKEFKGAVIRLADITHERYALVTPTSVI